MRDLLPPGVALQGERGIAFVIAGPSGAGKSSVISALLARDPRLVFSVSVTTRPPRPHEVHGRDYYFVSAAEFDRLLAEGALLEWTEYQGHRYGTPKSEVVPRLEQGLDVVLNVEVRGALALKGAGLGHPVVLIFLVPPSWEELVRRVRGRGTEDEAALRERLRIARHELSCIPAFEYLVVNDELEKAVARVEAIIQAERMRVVRCA
ncbi:guanylate kinase [Thermus sp.]|uniref:guanylate kinase n=1 Tax=Thermus sp. TaxID=275 RepID=UPI00260B33A3|nr:guanylate kinase [Thermus sp.]MCS7216274.1 guanylate kinase [Candidatus Bipolaricaulota bacterium]MCX7850249.1 guanylate kinase [Thermus sp.]MDW8151504.1 guanylate kinase [Candidatus Bipolaricaulota bacterium]